MLKSICNKQTNKKNIAFSSAFETRFAYYCFCLRYLQLHLIYVMYAFIFVCKKKLKEETTLKNKKQKTKSCTHVL